MKLFTRQFTQREKVLLSILVLIILASLYYLLIYQPVTDGISRAESSAQDLESQLIVLDTRVAQIQKMQKLTK